MHMDCWETIVDSWTTPEAYARRREKSGHAKGRIGPTHHQGSHPLGAYMDTWVPFTPIYSFIHSFIYSFSLRVIVLVFSSQTQSHGGQMINEFMGYVLSHQGKATDPDNVYDPMKGANAFTNPNAYEKVVQYTETVHKRHGEAYDPATEPLDTDVLMRTGGGKQHGRYFLAHNVIDPTTIPTLREVRRSDSTTSSNVPIQPRFR
jgi:hypothetical protein